MRIAQISDFHFTALSLNPLRIFSKRILGILNWLIFRKNEFNPSQTDLLPPLFRELGVDLVLFGGDFSSTSLSKEFEKGQKLARKMRSPWVAIPGNHDVYTFTSQRQKAFYRYFENKQGEIKEPVQFFTLKNDRVEVWPLRQGYRLIALDTAVATNPYSSQGEFTFRAEEKLKEVLNLLPQNEKLLLFTHYPFLQNDKKRRGLKRAEKLEEIIKNDPRIKIYLHGHTHRHVIADLQASNLPLVLDSGSCALKQRGTFNLIDLEDSGCKVHTYHFHNNEWRRKETDEFALV